MSNDWSIEEVNLIVLDYFSMLEAELNGIPINKSYHRKILKELLFNRTEGSIEFKHQNISAVLIKLGLPYIKGYKPMVNYQQILETSVLKFISNNKTQLEPNFFKFSDSIDKPFEDADYDQFIVEPPELNITLKEATANYTKKPYKINFLEREQNNSSLGLLGEEMVFNYEKYRLTVNGKNKLANEIEWISKNDDGAGFDILSKNLDGSDRYIEVKTTKLSKDSPFFFSKNEYEFSRSNDSQYYLYRLYNFINDPKMFLFNGCYDTFCNVEAIGFKGSF